MKNHELYLFTATYPYGNAEVFLEKELPFLAQAFDEVNISPETSNTKEIRDIPVNVRIYEFKLHMEIKPSRVVRKYWKIILKWWLKEFVKSPHRFLYIIEFRWNIMRFLGLLDAADRLKNALRDKSNLILYSYWFNEWATVLALAREIGLEGTFITRAHGYDFDEAQQARGYHPFRYSEIDQFDKVVQVSNYGLEYMMARMRRKTNIELSRLGVDMQELAPIGSETIYYVVSCSNMVPIKRIPLIAEILSKLNVDFYWTHFGDGPERDRVKHEVEGFISNKKFDFRGYIPNRDLMEYYRTTPVDLFINMSSLEGIPVSIMEAISFGIPVVGCSVCGVPEIVNSSTGCLLDRDVDTTFAAQRISEFLVTTSRDINFRKGVQEFMKTKFSANINYAQFIKKYLM